jgi:hypothetical protein
MCLGLAGVNPAAASIIYDFSLASNGSVGAIDIQLTFDSFVAAGSGLNQTFLSSAPVTSFTSGTPVISGAAALEVDAGSTLFSLLLLAPNSSLVLYTPSYPGDLFAFTRTYNQTGVFTATGNVISSLGLDTAQPIGTLVVTDTSVPEPATAALLGIGVLGMASWQMRSKAWVSVRREKREGKNAPNRPFTVCDWFVHDLQGRIRPLRR